LKFEVLAAVTMMIICLWVMQIFTNVLEEPAASTIIAKFPEDGGSTFLQNIGKHLPDGITPPEGNNLN
jgi:hypothetical protein